MTAARRSSSVWTRQTTSTKAVLVIGLVLTALLVVLFVLGLGTVASEVLS